MDTTPASPPIISPFSRSWLEANKTLLAKIDPRWSMVLFVQSDVLSEATPIFSHGEPVHLENLQSAFDNRYKHFPKQLDKGLPPTLVGDLQSILGLPHPSPEEQSFFPHPTVLGKIMEGMVNITKDGKPYLNGKGL